MNGPNWEREREQEILFPAKKQQQLNCVNSRKIKWRIVSKFHILFRAMRVSKWWIQTPLSGTWSSCVCGSPSRISSRCTYIAAFFGIHIFFNVLSNKIECMCTDEEGMGNRAATGLKEGRIRGLLLYMQRRRRSPTTHLSDEWLWLSVCRERDGIKLGIKCNIELFIILPW